MANEFFEQDIEPELSEMKQIPEFIKDYAIET